ncbi:MAG: universal stress protein, partial [Pirellulales bacterium]|nr:universal stress protein [Pirellulales bacterium]
ADSAGTVIDVLLSRCPQPMLVIRRDDQLLGDCVRQVSLVLGGECDVSGRAAAWLFGLAAENAVVTLNLVVEKEQYQNIRSILEALQPATTLEPDQFSAALTKTHQSMHSAMAKTASQRGLTYHLLPQAGEVAPPNPLSESSRMLLVMPLEVDDRFGQGFVQDRIRRSPHPVLVVPGHVAS